MRGSEGPSPRRTTALALGAAVLAVIALLLARGGDVGPLLQPPRSADNGPERGSSLESQAAADARADLAAAAAPAPAAPATATAAATASGPARARVRGHVYDLAGSPRAGLSIVESRTARVAATSALDGAFEADVAIESGLEARGEGVGTVLRHAGGGASDAAVIVVADLVDLAGRVVDAHGNAIADTRLWLACDAAALSRVPASLHATSLVGRGRVSSADGSFALAALPSGPGLALEVWREGYAAGRVPVPSASTSDLVVRLDRSAGLRALAGIVVDESGGGVAGASVRLGELYTTSTRPDGTFALPFGDDLEGASLFAWAPGRRAARVEGLGTRLAASDGDPTPVRLVLGPPPLSIRGRIVRADGTPGAGWKVSLASGTSASLHQAAPVWVEDLVAGRARAVASADDGSFVLGGLDERSYVLRARDERDTQLVVETEPVAAGAEVVVEVPADALRERVAGRVVARDGTPVAGILVTASIVRLQQQGALTTAVSFDSRSTTTDELGRFELERVPRRFLHLRASGDRVVPASVELAEEARGDEVAIEVSRSCAVRIGGLGPDCADDDLVAFVDAGGRTLWIARPGGYGGPTIALGEARLELLSVGEEARALVVRRGEQERLRRALRLEPGATTTVAP